MVREKGTIVKIVYSRGYGFIRRDNTDGDVFFHSCALLNCGLGQLREGTEVSYAVVLSPAPNGVEGKESRTRAIGVIANYTSTQE